MTLGQLRTPAGVNICFNSHNYTACVTAAAAAATTTTTTTTATTTITITITTTREHC